ncbi:MAG TPA: ribonuclease E/G, partial [Opitutaceae bacterium]|nr:ribonuclease E/G [Opitutaceae bacterium]
MSEQSNAAPENPELANTHEEELSRPPHESDSEPVNPAEIRNEARERAKQRPFIQKVLGVFRKEKATFRELIINSEPLEKRVAQLVEGILDKFEIERDSDERMVGGIFKGRVKNLDPGLKAAFVDIGFNKNAFLHYWDILPAAADSSV